MSVVICNLPKAGLGNQLFPLLKAYVFGELNNLPVFVTGYNPFFIGPYLRQEKSKRNYSGIFTFQQNVFKANLSAFKLLKYKNFHLVKEPPIQKIEEEENDPTAYIFSEMPHWDHYFDGLKEYRGKVIDNFYKLLRPEIKKSITAQAPPCVGVHIRMGDFRKLLPGEIYGQKGAVRAPEAYFTELIVNIRKVHGTNLPVTLFTDGYRHELKELFKLPAVDLVEGNRDITDLALLSQSKIIITSVGSTFSYWAGFLSDAVVILHPDHTNTSLRPPHLVKELYEGAFDTLSTLMVNAIKVIR